MYKFLLRLAWNCIWRIISPSKISILAKVAEIWKEDNRGISATFANMLILEGLIIRQMQFLLRLAWNCIWRIISPSKISILAKVAEIWKEDNRGIIVEFLMCFQGNDKGVSGSFPSLPSQKLLYANGMGVSQLWSENFISQYWKNSQAQVPSALWNLAPPEQPEMTEKNNKEWVG